jgi:hypothetical protein
MSTRIDLTQLIALLAELFPDVTPGEQPCCRECGAAEIRAKNLCPECYWRWDHAGRPEHVPPRQRRPRRAGSRLNDFATARAAGATVPVAAKYAGIPEHAGWRYEAEQRAAKAGRQPKRQVPAA